MIRIRNAKEGDFDEIVMMCTSSMKATYGHFLTDEETRPWIEGGKTEEYISEMLDHTLVAIYKEKVRGVSVLEDNLIDLIWVAIEYRGKGIGEALIEASESALKKKGVTEAKLECFEANTSSIDFYKTMGWHCEDTYKDTISGVNKVVMVKTLK